MTTVHSAPAARSTGSRPASRPWLAPVASAVAAGTGCGLVALADPGQGGYPVCPFRVLTGLWCPVCGSTRAVHALLHADVAAAASSNVLLVLVLPAVAYAWLAWASPRLGGPRLRRPRVAPRVWWALLALALTYGVLRNLPAFPVLAP